jgi:hypothetical protein
MGEPASRTALMQKLSSSSRVALLATGRCGRALARFDTLSRGLLESMLADELRPNACANAVPDFLPRSLTIFTVAV